MPIPGGPTISIVWPRPALAPAIASSMAAISSVRPTSGRSSSSRVHLHAGIGPDEERRDRVALALHHEGLERLGLEPRVGRVEDRARREHLAGLRLRHHARRQVHGVAHHGVGAPIARPDVAGEHRTPVDADPDRDRAARRRRSGAARAASAPRRRRSRGERRRSGSACRRRRRRRSRGSTTPCSSTARWVSPTSSSRPSASDAGALGRQDLVGAVEVEERDATRAGARAPTTAASSVSRIAIGTPASSVARSSSGRTHVVVDASPRGALRKQPALGLRGADAPRVEMRRRRGAQHDLAGRRRALHLDHAAWTRAP